jgi:hypothetical protein
LHIYAEEKEKKEKEKKFEEKNTCGMKKKKRKEI